MYIYISVYIYTHIQLCNSAAAGWLELKGFAGDSLQALHVLKGRNLQGPENEAHKRTPLDLEHSR